MKSRVALFCLLLAACSASASAAEHPNVVVILADDQGWGDLSINGNKNVQTPHIDSLAHDGAIFERFFVCPVCSPTRAEFLTGRYHPRGGVWNVSTGGERLDLDEKTVAQAFQAAGYATAAFGKWHNGTQYPYHPTGRGFTDYYGFCSGHWGDYFEPPLEHNGKLVRGEGYITDDLTSHAIEFIKKHQGGPFFCYLPFNTPHSPLQVPDEYYDKYKNADLTMRYTGRGREREDLDSTRAILAMTANIDANVGRVLRALDELKLADDTIVVYFSDNGPNTWRWNGGMRGRKGSTDEGGVRSPLLMRWPGHIAPKTRVPQIAAAIDLLPTLCALADVRPISEKALDGKSLAPLLLGSGADWPERTIFTHWGGNVSARTQQYRLDAQGRLYDMWHDGGQSADLAKEHPELAAKLKADVAAWKKELLPGLRDDKRPFTVGYHELPITWLPARDGVAHGTIKRSANAPNCSYYTYWTSVDDSITWDIEVATSGQYEAVVYYTCAPADVGVKLDLAFNGSHVSCPVTEAHDPPARGAEHDRVPRQGESYVKDFRPLRLGTMTLERGRGLLTLRATEIPGKHAIEMRTVTLTLNDPAPPSAK